MRLNSRWASRSTLTAQAPLLQAFKDLRATLDSAKTLDTVDTRVFLKPFLAVIQSDETSGPITGVALQSVAKFISCLVTVQSIGVKSALRDIAYAATHARFEATDPDSDEVVLSKILHVLLACIRGGAGSLMSDDMIYEMVQTCYRMAFQGRLSELLRKTAEYTLLEILLVVFDRYGEFDPVRAEKERAAAALSPLSGNDAGKASDKADKTSDKADKAAEFVNPSGVLFEQADAESVDTDDEDTIHPYGIVCLERLFDWLCDLVRPGGATDDQRSEKRALGLYLINALLEHRGMTMQRFPSLLAHIQNEVCHCLLQTLLTNDLGVLTLTLRLVFNLYSAMKQHLKTQLELLLRTMMAIVSRHQAAYEHQEVVLESFSELCRMPSFGTDVYVNYDCDMHATNLFEAMCKFFYKNAFPASGALYTIHLLSLGCLLSLLQAVHARVDVPLLEGLPQPQDLRNMARAKALLLEGSEKFNQDAKAGVKLLLSQNLVRRSAETPDDPDPTSMAQFLRTAPGLSPQAVGDFLGRNKPLNIAVLDAYLTTFDADMERLGFIDALRSFMESFRVLGEAQVIARTLEMFAAHFFEHGNGQGIFADPDAIYVLAYSVVMLNVDQHSGRVKKPMTEHDFQRMSRGCNGGENFELDMVAGVYQSIHSRDLRVPQESTLDLILRTNNGGNADDASGDSSAARPQKVPPHVWGDLLRCGERYQPFLDARGSSAFDQDLFEGLWRPTVGALNVVYQAASDDIVFKAVGGFELCARVGARFQLCEAVDAAVVALCKFSTLLMPPRGTVFSQSTDDLPELHERAHERPRAMSTPAGEVAITSSDDDRLTSSSSMVEPEGAYNVQSPQDLKEAAVRFGRDAKAQLAAAHAIRAANEAAPFLREAWRAVLLCVARLNAMEVLPVDLLALPVLFKETDMRPPKLYRKAPVKKAQSGSLLSYWFGGSASGGERVHGAPQQLSRQTTAALTDACRATDRLPLKQLLGGTAELSDESLLYLVRTLAVLAVAPPAALDEFPLPPSSHEAASTEDVNTEAENAPVTRRTGVDALPGALCVDLLARLLLDNCDRVARLGLWSVARERMLASLAEARRATPLLERTLNLFFLLVAELAPIDNGGSMSEEAVTSLAALLRLDENVLRQFCEHIACGVKVVFDRTAPVLRSAAAWETVMSLVGSAAAHERSVNVGFAVLCAVVDDAAFVTQENFGFVESAAFLFSRSTACESQVSVKALECLYQLHCRVRGLLDIRDRTPDPESEERRALAWSQYWLPLLRHLCTTCTDSRNDVRNAAMMILQRALLGKDLLALGPEGWYACFAEVLFPLSDALLIAPADQGEGAPVASPLPTAKAPPGHNSFLFSPLLAAATGIAPGERPKDWRTSGGLMERSSGDPLEETRLRASALLCKIFLHYASTIRPSPEFNGLWSSVLGYIARYMQADDSELLAEAVPESLKNILLVMSDSGVLREDAPEHEDFGLWTLTWTTIASFCPKLTPPSLGIGKVPVVVITEEEMPEHPAPVAEQPDVAQVPMLPVSAAVEPAATATSSATTPSAPQEVARVPEVVTALGRKDGPQFVPSGPPAGVATFL